MENPVYEDTLTITADINVTITGVLSLNDTLETFEFYTTETECGQIEPAIGIEYYKNNDDGLFMYAHKSIGGIVLPKIYLEKSILFKGLEFNDFCHLSNFVQQFAPNYRVVSDSIYYENPPVKSLLYPIEVDAQWTYRQDNNPWRMDKKVISRIDVELDGLGTFDCFEIKFLYDMDHDGEWDDDIWITDLISKKGLIQRDVTILRMVELTENGSTGRFFDGFDVYSLTDLSIE